MSELSHLHSKVGNYPRGEAKRDNFEFNFPEALWSCKKKMDLKDFSYDLPAERIAQQPCPQRDHSRMMILNRAANNTADFNFFDLPSFLQEGDVLVINESRVIPARISGRKETGSQFDILLLSKKSGDAGKQIWEVLLKPAKRLHENDTIYLEGRAQAQVLSRISDKKWLLQFTAPGNFLEYLQLYGRAPLPPYIRRPKNLEKNNLDRERYQTIYAKNNGSIAAPTAGLHFSPEVMQKLAQKGVLIAPVTLHVGYGTFLPITGDVVEDHQMEQEYYEISAASAALINQARRVIAVGTTSVRTLESAAAENGLIKPQSGWTSIFIYPGYTFKRIDGLLTNFHLPKSSLFLLVCAFAGTDFVKNAYRSAVQKNYFFYSYGDCMLII